jgi:hypothetical protein
MSEREGDGLVGGGATMAGSRLITGEAEGGGGGRGAPATQSSNTRAI